MTDPHPFAKGPHIMGIVNVTPDSFSDGGQFLDPRRAIEHGFRLAEEGAEILDIGGESTRPGAAPVSVQEEMDRVLPVIEGLKGARALISVDTRHVETMKAAVAAGAGMINDVTALTGAGALEVAAKAGVFVCLMHMQGNPQTMQAKPSYNNVVAEVSDFLSERVCVCEQAGIPRTRLIVDPGIGFGKSLSHNIELIHDVAELAKIGVPILAGLSRKSFIDAIMKQSGPGHAPEQRLPGSLAAALWCLSRGVQIFRVHDVAATRQAFGVFEAVAGLRR